MNYEYGYYTKYGFVAVYLDDGKEKEMNFVSEEEAIEYFEEGR